MPENFVYVRILQVKGDPRLRGDDEERAGMTPGQARGRSGDEKKPVR